jgi:2-oxoisovalerate dehydrogenase E1 component alpha subunit
MQKMSPKTDGKSGRKTVLKTVPKITAKIGAAKLQARNKGKSAGKSKTSLTVQKRPAKDKLGLPRELVLRIHDLMVKSRVLEERLIKIYKAGDAFFWIGAPGEEAWGVPLGLLTNKGHGVQHDYLHMHYRATPTLVAMGMPMIDSIRLIMNRATDVCAGGRNFANHYCFPQWNVVPVSSPIEVQYGMALGTAHAQKRHKAKGITVVTGGDAGTAEGDFASCLVWASRRGQELPLLITVQNNRWGISTSYDTQHGEEAIADRAKGFGIRSRVINGNDPIEAYLALQEEYAFVRKTGKPSFIEANTSRLYGHSSATGANFINDEEDCLRIFEEKLLSLGLLEREQIKELWARYEQEAVEATQVVRGEPAPTADSIWDHVYANNENADWRKF